MKRRYNASLKHLNSFSVEARARQLLVIESEQDLQQFVEEYHFDVDHDQVVGGGTNILFAADVKGTVVLNRLAGKQLIEDSEDSVLVEVCAGESWHELVLWSLDQGLSGLENLSLIPGLAGAAPIQNIGAYGVELADVLESVQTIELKSGTVCEFSRRDCLLGYRDSRFKSADRGYYLITRIRLRLHRRFTPRLAYAGVTDELHAMGISEPNAKQVSDAVIRIRKRKLPDPVTCGNAGSFFKNPLVSQAMAKQMIDKFRGLPVYPVEENMSKLSAAWMIEQCGWKGHRQGDAGVYDKHALVLVNFGKASGKDLLDLADRITDSVSDRFAIDLQPEPLIVK